ncbi:DcrB-related protein [Paenibacillus caui]|uniref:DcrB-related protein n=1 Tax=Paenibacillus caui TaxID=2873927 RepID=UPI001CA80EA2|nr:DcrB-related protein [Paenibacillus caui]
MKTTGDRISKLVLLTAASMVFIGGCGSKDSAVQTAATNVKSQASYSISKASYAAKTSKRHAIEATDGSLRLTVPDGWEKDDTLNRAAALAVSDRSREKYALIIPVSRNALSKGAALESFKKRFIADTKVALHNFRIVESKDISIGGFPAQTVEFYGTARNVNLHYLAAIMEKDRHFYQIITWSTESRFSDYKDEFLNVVQSFKILKENTAASVPVLGSAAAEASLLISSDQETGITVPEGWTADSDLTAGADLQASHPATEDYLVVLRERRSEFSQNTTITDYYRLVSDNMKHSIQNARQDKPRQTSVGGLTAVQFMLSGEVDKVKVSYLVTLVASGDHFTQVLLWTRSDQMEEKLKTYKYIVNSFREL